MAVKTKKRPGEDLSFLPDQGPDSGEDLSFLPDQHPAKGEDLSFLPDQGAPNHSAAEDLSFLPDKHSSEVAPPPPAAGTLPGPAASPTNPVIEPNAGTSPPGAGGGGPRRGLLSELVRQALPAPFQPAVDAVVVPAAPEKPAPPEQETISKAVASASGPLLGPLLETKAGKRLTTAAASGEVGTGAGLLAAIPAASGFMGLKEGKIAQTAQKSAEALTQMAGRLMPENPNFVDQLASGAGSMALFMVPGAGSEAAVAQIPRMGALAAKLAPAIGAGVSAVLEAATESGTVFQDMVRKGAHRELAAKAAFDDFWKNVILVGVTNKLGIFGDAATPIKRAIMSASTEGLQEGVQSILASRAKDEPIDWKDVLTSAGVGGLLGVGTGAAIHPLVSHETEISEATLGPNRSEYLKSKFPTLFEGINGVKAPLSEEQLNEVLVQSAAAGEETLLKGGTPEEADAAATQAFAKAAEPLVAAQTQEAQTEKPAKPTIEESLQAFNPEEGPKPEGHTLELPGQQIQVTPEEIQSEAKTLQERSTQEGVPPAPVETFVDEARRNLNFEKMQESADRGAPPAPEVASQVIEQHIADLQARAKSAAQQVLSANKIDDRVLINLVDAIAVDPKAFREGRGRDFDPSKEFVPGETRRVYGHDRIAAVMNLARGASEFTGRHEAFHAVSNILLDEAEQNIIQQKYGDMEKAADAFGEYRAGTETGDTLIDRIFAKVQQFLEKFSNLLDQGKFTSAQELFDAVEKGRLADRAARAETFAPLGPSQYSAKTLMRRLLKRTESSRPETQSPEFRAWFGNSKVVDENGNPKVVFHGTNNQFSEFDPSRRELGFHFGSAPQANERINELSQMRTGQSGSGEVYSSGASVMPVYLSLEHPVRVAEDVGGWDDVESVKQALDAEHLGSPVFSSAELSRANSIPALRSLIQSKGFDGIVYPNDFEGRSDSYIVFEPEQIKSAFNLGQWSPENPDIRYSASMKQAGAPNSPAFKAWFQDSKVVDEQGNPQVVYHGTGTKIDEFKYEFTNQGNDQYGSGFYFTTDENQAKGYTKNRIDPEKVKPGGEDNPNVIEAFLSIQHPLNADRESFFPKYNIAKFIDRSPIRREALMNFADVDYEGEAKARRAALDAYFPGKGEKVNTVKALFSIANDFYPDNVREFNEAVRDILGYDGAVKSYPNGVKHYVAFFPEQIKLASGNVGTFDPKNPGIQYSAEQKERQNAPTFYSHLSQTIEKKMPNRAAPELVRNIVSSQDVKQEETDWSGIKEWLADRKGPVTKAEVLDFLKENQVGIQEVVKGESQSAIRKKIEDAGYKIIWTDPADGEDAGVDSLAKGEKLYDRQNDFEGLPDDIKNLAFDLSEADDRGGTKFQQYTLPGGENYREMLFTLPNTEATKLDDRRREIEKLGKNATTEQKQEWVDIMNRLKPDSRDIEGIDRFKGFPEFRSSHFSEPNVLAHVRFNERTDAEGKKTLFIEEVQSDWHQRGRDSGYKGNAIDNRIAELQQREQAIINKAKPYADKGKDAPVEITDEFTAVRDEIYKLEEASRKGVPDAPFKKTWHELVLKRMLRWAAENGFDKVAWTTGEQQAERYDLSKQVQHIAWEKNDDGTYNIAAPRPDGSPGIYKEDLTLDKVKDLVGKDIALKVGAGEGEKQKEQLGRQWNILKGDDLKVGGHGMEGFYDKIIPSFLNKYTKKWGGRVGETTISQAEGPYKTEVADKNPEVAERLKAKVHSLDITPDMKKAVLEVGQPQYSAEEMKPGSDGRVPEKAYEMNRQLQPTRMEKFRGDVKQFVSEIGRTTDEYLGAISTRLGNIHPSLRQALRSYEFHLGQRRNGDLLSVEPFVKKLNETMTPQDKADFDLARKNGDPEKIQHLVLKYNLGKEYYTVRKVLNDLYNRAKQVGFEIGYRENYHPRKLKDSKGFLDYVAQRDDWSIIQEAIAERQQVLGRYLSTEEKAELVNQLIRGYSKGQIALSKTGNMKDRLIDYVDPLMNRFYYDSDAALIRYLGEVNDAVEARRFFGKSAKEPAVSGGAPAVDIQDSIGFYVLDLVQRGLIKPSQEKEVRRILDARFNQTGVNGVVGFLKNMSYIDAMGSPISALTQLGDLGLSLYRLGPLHTMFHISKAMFGKGIGPKELGVDKILEEYADHRTSMKALDKTFRWIGLGAMDMLGKRVIINGVLEKYQRQARMAKPPKDFLDRLSYTMGPEAPQTIQDLKDGKITENVKLLAFNELLDVQPVALSEMPEKYLSGGNGRVFYMLKSYQLKQMDLFRREAFQKLSSPKMGDKAEGVRRLVALAAALAFANGGADVIKNLFLNRPTYLPDVVVDNVMRLFGLSKYAIYDARNNGIASAAIKTILPPFKAIDSAYKDFGAVDFSKEGMDQLQGNFWKGEKLELPSSIPFIGKLYYWWFGKGVEKSAKTQAKIDKARFKRENAR